jgi:phage-related protein
MFPWFEFNGTDSRSFTGLWITKLPGITRPEERVNRVKIPGRAGSVTMTEGEKVFESYLRECVITVSNSVDFDGLTNWLQGEGDVVFSNEPLRRYRARISGGITFDKLSNDLRQATIPFFCEPYKAQEPIESDITVDDNTTIYNPGNIESRPIVVLNGTGEASLTIGDKTMSFANLPGELKIDCDAEIITVLDGDWDNAWEGDFFRIVPGNSTVEIDGCTATITPKWRWV